MCTDRTVLYFIVLYCTVLYCTVLYYTVLYCTVPLPPGGNSIAVNKYIISFLREGVHRLHQTLKWVHCTEKVRTPVLKWAVIAQSV